MDGSTINTVLLGVTILVSVGGSYGIVQSGVKENARRIKDLEDNRKDVWKAIGAMVKEVSEVTGMVKAMLEHTK